MGNIDNIPHLHPSLLFGITKDRIGSEGPSSSIRFSRMAASRSLRSSPGLMYPLDTNRLVNRSISCCNVSSLAHLRMEWGSFFHFQRNRRPYPPMSHKLRLRIASPLD